MEVSGKKIRHFCKPCEQRNTSTYSDGFCQQCEEEMCQSCFDTHKQWKLNREHRIVSSDEASSQREESQKLDTCSNHLNEAVKFFCPEHGQVGCGDCMVISHKTCKVVYILEHIKGYQTSKEFKSLKSELAQYDREANTEFEKTKRERDVLKDVHKKFVRDVNSSRDEMISYITKLADEMLMTENDALRADMKNIDQLEKESTSLVKETSKIKETLQAEADQPYKLFISCVSYKRNLHLVKEQLERIREKNTTETYEFKRDNNLAQVIKGCKQIGTIQKTATREAAKSAFREEAKRGLTEASVIKSKTSLKRQPLLERQLISKNLDIDGDIIRYCEQMLGDFGIFVDKNQVKLEDTFEIQILAVGSKVGSIAIGVIPEDYPYNLLPGIGVHSCGYHSDGNVYNGSATGRKCGEPWRVGDKISIALYFDEDWEKWWFHFIHNGKKIDGNYLPFGKSYHIAICMKSIGDAVKVTRLP